MAESCSGSCSSCSSNCGSCGQGPDRFAEKMAKIKHWVMVMSGKGGVGKSTVAALLAAELAREGSRVGLLDVDFHGPSQPTLFNVQHLRLGARNGEIEPLETAGVKLVSIGLLLDESDRAVIWRGPAKMGVIRQLVEEVDWGELDYLVLDFPPGTGDEALSACQLFTGEKRALVVTTPQEVALADCRKCIDFCHQLELPVAGVVENMSFFVCPDCKSEHYIFSRGGGDALAAQAGVKVVAHLPLDPDFLQQCDHGNLPLALTGETRIAEGARALAAAVRQSF